MALLRDMEKLPFAERESLRCAVIAIKEVRWDVNADFTEQLADSEHSGWCELPRRFANWSAFVV